MPDALPRRDHRALSRRARCLLVAGLGLLLPTGCADPQSGGGTELPVQVRIYGSVNAKAWRLWSVEDVDPGTGAPDTRFLSRGVLRDSGGVLVLPNSPGVYLLEGWTRFEPDDSISVSVSSGRTLALDSQCIETIPQDGEIHFTTPCGSMKTSESPSGLSGASAPDQVTLVRLAGAPPQSLQVLSDNGSAKILVQEARLWSIGSDTLGRPTLSFRGALTSSGSGEFDFPPLRGKTTYLLEGSTKATSLGRKVPARIRLDSTWSRTSSCLETILPPLPRVLSVHMCPGLGVSPSGAASDSQGADIWSVFTTDIP
ncbi:MAG: hypothetical protein H6686_06135 [Fibrobacteria bacterium]|nr:hypothetical protein [Fibrobacteria bacterium]